MGSQLVAQQEVRRALGQGGRRSLPGGFYQRAVLVSAVGPGWGSARGARSRTGLREGHGEALGGLRALLPAGGGREAGRGRPAQPTRRPEGCNYRGTAR